MKYPNRLKRLRERADLTQEQLAAELGFARETIEAWENGNKPIRRGMLIKLSQRFNVSSDYLLLLNFSSDFDPCPFCGKNPIAYFGKIPNAYDYHYSSLDYLSFVGIVECAHCRIRMSESWGQDVGREQGMMKLAERWNRRA